MSLKSLNSFVIAAELGSFSEASRAIGVTPAAVSKSIQELERELGVRLFHRNTHALSLTEDGVSLLNDVKPALTSLEQALKKTRNTLKLPQGKLKINIPESFGKKFILPLVAEFLERYPQITLDIYLQDRKIDPISEGFDLSIGNLEEADSGLIARDLCELHLSTFGSREYIRINGAPKSPSDLERHNLIAYKQLSTGRIAPWRYKVSNESISINPTARLALSNIESVAQCIKEGLGLGCIGAWHVKEELANGCVVEVLSKYRPTPLKVKMYYPSKDLQSKKVRVLIDFLVEKSKSGAFA
jgi:DNA-binding transcriptional LysR family regulator